MISVTVYKHDSILNFGIYKNKTLAQACSLNNDYINWRINNVANFCVEEESIKILLQNNPKIKLTREAFSSNKFKLELYKLNNSNINGLEYFKQYEELEKKYLSK